MTPFHSLTTDFGYDENSNLVTLTDPRNNTREWIRDERDLVVRKQYPELSDKENFRYDALGRKIVYGQQNGATTHYVFDLAGRTTERIYGEIGTWPADSANEPPATPGTVESTDTFEYDGASRLLESEKGRYGVTTQHTYAENGLPLSESYLLDGRTYTLQRSYDDGNRAATQTFADGKVLEWQYDERDNVVRVLYDGDEVLTQSHDLTSRLTGKTFGNGLERTVLYNRADDLRTRDTVEDTGVIDDLDFSYTYAPDKNVLSETTDGGMLDDLGFMAGYDPGNRLVSWVRGDSYPGAVETQTWSYDDAGNWNATTVDGVQEDRVHNNSDETTDVEGDSLSYDDHGNLTEDNVGNVYEWDLDNRLASVDSGSNAFDEIEYRYDAMGRRVFRKQTTIGEVLLWWGDLEYSEHLHQAGQATVQNDIHAHPTALNTVFGRALAGSANSVQYFHKNYLDHVYAVSDDLGNVVENYRYSAFGEPEVFNAVGVAQGGSVIGNDVLWNSKRLEDVALIYLYKYRHYSTGLGRWLSADPIGERGGMNLYGYVFNDPINRWDIYGLDVWVEGGSGDEPAGHQSICVGDPNGFYEAFSFGVPKGAAKFSLKHGLTGHVYEDLQGGGGIDPDSYLKTDLKTDHDLRRRFQEMVNSGSKTSYRLANKNCRTFSQEKFSEIEDALTPSGKATPAPPPKRTKPLFYPPKTGASPATRNATRATTRSSN